MSSSQYIEMVTVLVSLMGVVLLITLLWFLLRKFVLGRSLLKPADKEVAPPSPVTQQVAAAVASPAQPLGAVTPTDEQPAAGATPVPSPQECPSPRGRGFAAAARRASVAVSRAVKQETTAILQSLAAGAVSAQAPTDDDYENEDNKVNKPGAEAAPPKDDATAGPLAPSSDQKGCTKLSPSTQFTTDGAAGKDKQAGVSGGDDPASPSPGRERGAEEQVPKERTHTKTKDKKRKKSSAPASACASPQSEKPETSTIRTKRKHKLSPDVSPKPPTENSAKTESPTDAEQSPAAVLPAAHA